MSVEEANGGGVDEQYLVVTSSCLQPSAVSFLTFTFLSASSFWYWDFWKLLVVNGITRQCSISPRDANSR